MFSEAAKTEILCTCLQNMAFLESGVMSCYELKLIAIWGGSQIKDVKYRPKKKQTNETCQSTRYIQRIVTLEL